MGTLTDAHFIRIFAFYFWAEGRTRIYLLTNPWT